MRSAFAGHHAKIGTVQGDPEQQVDFSQVSLAHSWREHLAYGTGDNTDDYKAQQPGGHANQQKNAQTVSKASRFYCIDLVRSTDQRADEQREAAGLFKLSIDASKHVSRYGGQKSKNLARGIRVVMPHEPQDRPTKQGASSHPKTSNQRAPAAAKRDPTQQDVRNDEKECGFSHAPNCG